MCGILVYIDNNKTVKSNEELYNQFMNINNRGPDHSSFNQYSKNVFIGFHRLAIMGPSPVSNQPYVVELDNGETAIFVCNGEIYNYKKLNETYNLGITTNSDCLVIPLLYKKCGMDYMRFVAMFENEIEGEFSFVMTVLNSKNEVSHIVAGRDQIGIRPLYHGQNGSAIFSSEIKACTFFNGPVTEFKPGTIQRFCYDDDGVMSYVDLHPFEWVSLVSPVKKTDDLYLLDVKNALFHSIEKRLTADAPIGFLLSGGVDSSLVCAIASELSLIKKPIRTFCCGLAGGSDLKYARMVAEYIGADHTEVIFTEEEALDAINDVIYTTETWDTTTIRASVGQYLVSKFIKENTDIKVLLVGEGPDEICSSYLFNWYAPSASEMHYAALDYISNIHKYDVRRVDRCLASFGLEARVPYLDPEFIKAYWEIPPERRTPQANGIEKWWLRKCADGERPLLPQDVMWRKKEAFSDGISAVDKSWFSIIKEHIYEMYGLTEEQYYIHSFVEMFGKQRFRIIDGYWQPKWDKDGNVISSYVDPSARTLDVYNKTT